jgi:RNase H-fold protein (predicted Holliday junction resolvase)
MDAVIAFKEHLSTLTATPVLTWDERFTSKLAESGAKRSGDRDSIAACYTLQDYLDWRSRA